MLVGRHNIGVVIDDLWEKVYLAIDTETTGLRSYHGDRPFALIIATKDNEFYFNLKEYKNFPKIPVLSADDLAPLRPLLANPRLTTFFANAPFDLAMVRHLGLEIGGHVHDVLAQERIIFNDHTGAYNLATVAKKYGYEKLDTVEKYVKENKLITKVPLAWRKQAVELHHYDQVPPDIMVTYAEKDGRITYDVGRKQIALLESCAKEIPQGLPSILDVSLNEARLSKTCFEMEWRGVQCDRKFSSEAVDYWHAQEEVKRTNFKALSGKPYMASSKLFAEIFSADKERWTYTDKGNPSFESDTLVTFDNPLAKVVCDAREAKSKLNFFNGFIYHMDSSDVVHPSWNQSLPTTGRFSSSNPNFQNTEKPEFDGDATLSNFTVRRGIVPRRNHVLVAPDFDQVEYRLMMEYAARMKGAVTPLIEKVLAGLDVHSAMAEVVFKEVTIGTRQRAKAINFGLLFGQGNRALAHSLKTTKDRARAIREMVFKEAPEIEQLIQKVINTAVQRKKIFNWAGRVLHYPDSRFAYKAPNGLIQSGAADVMKFFMVKFDEVKKREGWESALIMTVHDQPVVEVPYDEIKVVPQKIKEMMETTFPHKYLPLTAGMMWSDKSLADLVKGMPA